MDAKRCRRNRRRCGRNRSRCRIGRPRWDDYDPGARVDGGKWRSRTGLGIGIVDHRLAADDCGRHPDYPWHRNLLSRPLRSENWSCYESTQPALLAKFFRLQAETTRIYDCRVTVDNDANAAGLAERSGGRARLSKCLSTQPSGRALEPALYSMAVSTTAARARPAKAGI